MTRLDRHHYADHFRKQHAVRQPAITRRSKVTLLACVLAWHDLCGGVQRDAVPELKTIKCGFWPRAKSYLLGVCPQLVFQPNAQLLHRSILPFAFATYYPLPRQPMIKVLLVDHARDEQCNVRQVLAASGINDFELHRVISYRQILQGFRSTAYDVYVIDSATGNGLKLVSQARSVGCTAPIVLVTSGAAREAIEAMRYGVSDCLVRDELSASQIECSLCYAVVHARSLSLQLQRERRYLALLDNANEIIYTHDLRGNFTSLNPSGERLLGYSEAEILRLNIAQLVVPHYQQLMETNIGLVLNGQPQIDQIELVTKSGYTIPVELGSHSISWQGKPVEIQSIGRSLDSRECFEVTSEYDEAPASPYLYRNLNDFHPWKIPGDLTTRVKEER